MQKRIKETIRPDICLHHNLLYTVFAFYANKQRKIFLRCLFAKDSKIGIFQSNRSMRKAQYYTMYINKYAKPSLLFAAADYSNRVQHANHRYTDIRKNRKPETRSFHQQAEKHYHGFYRQSKHYILYSNPSRFLCDFQ